MGNANVFSARTYPEGPPRHSIPLAPHLLLALLLGLGGCANPAANSRPPTLEPAAVVGSPLGTPVAGDFVRGNTLFRKAFTLAEGAGPVFNDADCIHCHNMGGAGGAGTEQELVDLMAIIDAGPDGIVDRSDLRAARGYNPLRALGGHVRQARAPGLADDEDNPTQEVIDAFVAEAGLPPSTYRLITTQRVGNPVFGSGLLSAIPAGQIEAYARWQNGSAFNRMAGISGRPHYLSRPGDGARYIGRLGWKAQETDALSFNSGAAVEEAGLSHPRNPTENQVNSWPTGVSSTDLTDIDLDDLTAFANFLAPPKPGNQGYWRVKAGRRAFLKAGCASCHHTPRASRGVLAGYVTGDLNPLTATGEPPLIPTSPGYGADAQLYRRETGLHNRRINAFSDLLLHDMGEFLADGFAQENASGSEFKTAPLWGVGLKNGWLHDGRASDLNEAVIMHAGVDGSDRTSEAWVVVNNYLGRKVLSPGSSAYNTAQRGRLLSAGERGNLITFLKSLDP